MSPGLDRPAHSSRHGPRSKSAGSGVTPLAQTAQRTNTDSSSNPTVSQSDVFELHSQSQPSARCCRCVTKPCIACSCVRHGRNCSNCRFGENCPNFGKADNNSDALGLADYIAGLRRNGRLLPRIPKAARIAVAGALAQRITAAVSEGTQAAWKYFLGFAYATLCVHVSGKQPHKLSHAAEIRRNIACYEESNEVPDVQPAQRAPAAAARRTTEQIMSRRASSKLADGDVRGALRVLTSDDSFAHPSDEVVACISDKHPEQPADQRDFLPPTDDVTPLIATEADVLRAINSFPPSSSAGLDGIRPAHLRFLVSRSTSEAGARLLTALTMVTNLALSGQIPDFAAEAFYGASLIALRKKDGGLRPIAIGSVYRRIAAKVAVSCVSSRIGAELRPAQLGVATRSGCEAAVHAVRSFVTATAESNQQEVIVKLDMANAFNTVRRDSMLEAVRSRLPAIYPLVWQSYSSASPLYIDNKKIWSRTGIQQGDPLSSLLFSLAVDDVAKTADTDINVWYLDDATLGGPLELVTRNIQRITTSLEKLGLKINSTKCEAILLGADVSYWRNTAMETLRTVLPDVRETDVHSMQLLGSPICAEQVREQLLSGEQMVSRLVQRVQKLEEAHQAFFLLKNYVSAPRLLYLLRSAPAYQHPSLLARIDEVVRRGAVIITNVDLHDSSWRQATLPARLGGLGIRKVSDLALPAYLASIKSSRSLIIDISAYSAESLGRLETGLLEDWWRVTGVGPPEDTKQHHQNTWDNAAATVVANQLLDTCSSDVDRARLRAAAQPHSGAWLNAFPVSSIGMLLDRDTLRTAVALRVGADVCAPHHCRCGALMNARGLHALSCQLSAGRLPRHAALNDVIKRALLSAGMPSVLEPPGLDRGDGRRPDGMTTFPFVEGKCLLWDATCADTYATSVISKSAAHAGAAATAAEGRKRRRYAELGRRYRFQPVAVETCGVFGQSTLSFLKELGRRITRETGDRRETEFLFQRVSIAVVRGNSTSLQLAAASGNFKRGFETRRPVTAAYRACVRTPTNQLTNLTTDQPHSQTPMPSANEILDDLLNLDGPVTPTSAPQTRKNPLAVYRALYEDMQAQALKEPDKLLSRDPEADPELARYLCAGRRREQRDGEKRHPEPP